MLSLESSFDNNLTNKKSFTGFFLEFCVKHPNNHYVKHMEMDAYSTF